MRLARARSRWKSLPCQDTWTAGMTGPIGLGLRAVSWGANLPWILGRPGIVHFPGAGPGTSGPFGRPREAKLWANSPRRNPSKNSFGEFGGRNNGGDTPAEKKGGLGRGMLAPEFRCWRKGGKPGHQWEGGGHTPGTGRKSVSPGAEKARLETHVAGQRGRSIRGNTRRAR